MTLATEGADPNSRRSSALAGWSERFAVVSAEPANFSMREIAFATQVNLRGSRSESAFPGAARLVLGFDLPEVPNTWNGTPVYSAIWLGPDEWLVAAPAGLNESIVPALHRSLLGMHHAVTDVSANRTIIEIGGDDARPVLAKGCPLDLHADAFKPGQCAQTVLAKSPIILQCLSSGPLFRLYVRNSFAQYVATWLVDAAAEFSASRGLDSGRIAQRLA